MALSFPGRFPPFHPRTLCRPPPMTVFPPSRISFRRMGMAAAMLLLSTLAATDLAAQAQPANVRLHGQVVDVESGQPLPEAYVGFPSLNRSVLTDREGRFSIAVPPGDHQLVFMRVGYKSAMLPMTMEADREVRLRATPEPVVLEALEATIDLFEERRSQSTMESRAFDVKALEEFGHPATVEFLTQRAGMWLTPCTAGADSDPVDACAFVRGETMEPTVIVDETMLPRGLHDLRMIPLRDLHRIEVYRGGELIVAYTRTFLLQNLGRRRTLHSIAAFRNWGRAPENSIQPQKPTGSMENP